MYKSVSLLIVTGTSLILSSTNGGADARGAPGLPNYWATARKQAIITTYEPISNTGGHHATSPVWATIGDGRLTEVFFPTVDHAQINDMEFLVTDGSHYFSEQKRDTLTSVSMNGSGMTVLIHGQEAQGHYEFDQKIVTDSAAPVVRIITHIHFNQPGLRLFVLVKPAINNTGNQNIGEVTPDGMYASAIPTEPTLTGNRSFLSDVMKSRFLVPAPEYARTHSQAMPTMALASSAKWLNASVGYVGFSDGWQDISQHYFITEPSKSAGPGNIALTGELDTGNQQDFTFEMAMGFGGSQTEAMTYAQTSLRTPFNQVQANYEQGWNNYLNKLRAHGGRFMSESSFAQRAAQIIKMHEDKLNRGAIVASLSNPAIPDGEEAQDSSGGYHLVWPRDLYHASMGLLAAGDIETPRSVLSYYDQTQMADGHWSQNFFVDGTPHWTAVQMDEASVPILLASKLQKSGLYRLSSQDLNMVRKAAQYLINNGPATQEDRWEEIGGFVPATIASEIAALRAESELTNDAVAAQKANEWQSMLETWTFMRNGPLGGSYYLRVSPHGNPASNETIGLANGAGNALAPEIIDGGFLELVRLGIRAPNDPRILSTLKVYTNPAVNVVAEDSWGGLTFRRYNHDQYGTNHVAGYWPLLAGEFGHYLVAAGNIAGANTQLHLMETNSLWTGLIPEQTDGVAPRGGPAPVGNGVASPLVWAHAEDLVLHRSIEDEKVFDAP